VPRRRTRLSASAAEAIIDRVRGAVADHWDDACDLAQLTAHQRQTLHGREFGNEYAFWDSP